MKSIEMHSIIFQITLCNSNQTKRKDQASQLLSKKSVDLVHTNLKTTAAKLPSGKIHEM